MNTLPKRSRILIDISDAVIFCERSRWELFEQSSRFIAHSVCTCVIRQTANLAILELYLDLLKNRNKITFKYVQKIYRVLTETKAH